MATVEAEILTALMARVATLPTALPVLHRERIAELPAECVIIDYLPNEDVRVQVSGGEKHRMGILQMTLCSKPGQFEVVYREVAALLAAHFAANDRLTSGAVILAIVKTDVGRGAADGPHWRTPIRVFYEAYA